MNNEKEEISEEPSIISNSGPCLINQTDSTSAPGPISNIASTNHQSPLMVSPVTPMSVLSPQSNVSVMSPPIAANQAKPINVDLVAPNQIAPVSVNSMAQPMQAQQTSQPNKMLHQNQVNVKVEVHDQEDDEYKQNMQYKWNQSNNVNNSVGNFSNNPNGERPNIHIVNMQQNFYTMYPNSYNESNRNWNSYSDGMFVIFIFTISC